MYHSVTIGDKNTWDDWHLIPKSRPHFEPPDVKSNYVNIPGGDSSIDLTESLTGKPLYKNRSGFWDFYVANDYEDWHEIYEKIMQYLHGKKLRAVLEDEPDYYYEGRFTLTSWRNEPGFSTLTIGYNVSPYKRSIQSAGEDWLWDPFNFETGVIQMSLNELNIDGNAPVTIYEPGIMMFAPIIRASKTGMSVTWNGVTYDLKKGDNVIPQIRIEPGSNTLMFHGTGKISIVYHGGML